MEEQKEVLEEYIKKGLEKGFNINYIKDTLVKHGHNQESVDTAANNVGGLKVPEQLRPHLEEEGITRVERRSPVALYAVIIILILILGFFVVNYFSNKSQIAEVQSELDEIEELGVSIDDLSASVKTQLELIKEKDLTIEEKEDIIEDQIEVIEEINNKIEEQRLKVQDILLDIMNRMIGRMSE